METKTTSLWTALLIVGGLLGALAIFFGAIDEGDETRTIRLQPIAIPVAADGEQIVVSEILTTPQLYRGVSLDGAFEVASVVTERGFWIKENGRRAFVLIDARGSEDAGSTVQLESGQKLEISGARVYTPNDVGSVAGVVDRDTREIIAAVPAFLVVDAERLDVL